MFTLVFLRCSQTQDLKFLYQLKPQVKKFKSDKACKENLMKGDLRGVGRFGEATRKVD